MRYPLIIGNWKLNGNKFMLKEFITDFTKEMSNDTIRCKIAIAPPIVYLDFLKKISSNSTIFISSQNVDINLSGAFTGEISALMLKDIGVKYVIIGHSERRIYHKESDEFIAKKFVILKKQNLIPVLCIGETETENRSGKVKEICVRQIDAILKIKDIDINIFENTVIAYEPIWAIGTGRSASALYVQMINKFIRDYIAEKNIEISKKITLQYGGSVNFNNAKELFSQPDIDGAIVGNESLKAKSFAKIVRMLK